MVSNRTKKSKRIRTLTRKMKGKLLGIVFIILAALAVLCGRLIYINEVKGSEYEAKVMGQQTYTSKTIPFKRGDILDRNGNVLATSVKVYNLVLDPDLILTEDKDYLEPTVNALVTCFGYDKAEITQLIKDNAEKKYLVKDKQLTYDQIAGFQEMMADTENYPGIKGVTFEEEYKRMYPYSTLACSSIGFTVQGNVGNWGIEEYYNDELNGTDGRKFGYVNEDNIMDPVVKQAVDGNVIVSTLDTNLQEICEKYMNSWIAQYSPANVAVVMADPNNGEILAMCSSNNVYDLNNPRDLSRYYTEEQIAAMSEEDTLNNLNAIWRNYLVSDSYEAGSTIKPFTVAGALETGKISQNQTFVCDGGQVISGSNIPCHKRAGHGTLTVEQAIMNSCNDCLMQIAALEGIDTFCEYQNIFNFGIKSGIDLPGEASCAGLLYTADNMTAIDLATNSFGQNFNVNAMQMVAGFSSLINGGYYYKPHIVKQIKNAEGGVVENYGKELIKQTITGETSDFLRQALVNTVVTGTGKTAAVAGYTVGGKTGTAQHHDKSDDNYLLSFLGYAEVDNEAKVVCYVIVDSPNVDNKASSAYACQLFSAIMTEALPYLDIFPQTEEDVAAYEAQVQQQAAAEAETAADGTVIEGTTEGAAAEGTTTEGAAAEGTTTDGTVTDGTAEGSTEEETVPASFSEDESYDEGGPLDEVDLSNSITSTEGVTEDATAAAEGNR